MAAILAYLPETRARIRLKAAVEGTKLLKDSTLVVAAGWEDLWTKARTIRADLAIFDPFQDPEPNLSACAEFAARFPSVAVVPYGDFNRRPLMDVLELGRMGIRVVVARDMDDEPQRFARILTSALPRSLENEVLRRVGDLVPPHLEALFRFVLSESYRPLDPSRIARVYHRHPKTLREHLRAAGLPSTRKLIGWGRLFHAAHALRDPGRGIEATAHLLEFPSAAALRGQIVRYTGLHVQDLLARPEALEIMLDVFELRHACGHWDTWPGLSDPGPS